MPGCLDNEKLKEIYVDNYIIFYFCTQPCAQFVEAWACDPLISLGIRLRVPHSLGLLFF
jgi:hypothetical protein